MNTLNNIDADINDTDADVNDFLTQEDIKFTCQYLGERTQEAGHTTDAWICHFTCENGGEEIWVDFFTGLGLRSAPNKPSDGSPAPRRNTLMWEELEKTRKPIAPSATSVLHSLILDSQCHYQSFESWCSDFDFDEDSNKALSTYEACQQNGDKLRRIFSSAALAQLETLLRDY